MPGMMPETMSDKPATEIAVAALLFDMDGTLVDSAAVVHSMYRRWAAKHGIELEGLMRAQHGRRSIETATLYAHLGYDVAAETAWMVEQERTDPSPIVEVPGAAALLRSLPPERWAVVTSADRVLALRRLRAAGLPLPGVLVTADDVARGKPDPECFLMGAARLGFPAADCLVLEDAPAGLAGGRAAGAKVLALSTTLTPEELAPLPHVPDYRGVTARFEAGQVILRIMR